MPKVKMFNKKYVQVNHAHALVPEHTKSTLQNKCYLTVRSICNSHKRNMLSH